MAQYFFYLYFNPFFFPFPPIPCALFPGQTYSVSSNQGSKHLGSPPCPRVSFEDTLRRSGNARAEAQNEAPRRVERGGRDQQHPHDIHVCGHSLFDMLAPLLGLSQEENQGEIAVNKRHPGTSHERLKLEGGSCKDALPVDVSTVQKNKKGGWMGGRMLGRGVGGVKGKEVKRGGALSGQKGEIGKRPQKVTIFSGAAINDSILPSADRRKTEV